MPGARRESDIGNTFLTFWVGQSVSLFGSRITAIALPLTAVVTLHASAMDMGALTAMQAVPSLVAGAPAGVWADRHRRRPIMLAADLLRAGLVLTIPLAAWSGRLSLGLVYAVALLTGIGTVFFGAAYVAWLPGLVGTAHLLKANSRLAASESVAQVVGPGAAGMLVALLSAPVALLADGLSFIVSAGSLAAIRGSESTPARPERLLLREAWQGASTLLHQPVLRALVACSATFNLFDKVLFAVYVLLMVRVLHLGPTLVGLVFGLGGLGGLLGAVAVPALDRRLGTGRAILLGVMMAAGAEALIAGAAGPMVVAFALVALAEAAVECGAAIYGIHAATLRQTLAPDDLRGRVAASSGAVTQGVGLLGAPLGGWLGQTIGLRPTVLIAGIGTCAALVWLVRSSIPAMRAIPDDGG